MAEAPVLAKLVCFYNGQALKNCELSTPISITHLEIHTSAMAESPKYAHSISQFILKLRNFN